MRSNRCATGRTTAPRVASTDLVCCCAGLSALDDHRRSSSNLALIIIIIIMTTTTIINIIFRLAVSRVHRTSYSLLVMTITLRLRLLSVCLPVLSHPGSHKSLSFSFRSHENSLALAPALSLSTCGNDHSKLIDRGAALTLQAAARL